MGKNEVKPGNVVYKDYMQRRKAAYDNLLRLQSGANEKAKAAGMSGVSLNTTNSDMGSYIGEEPKTDDLLGIQKARVYTGLKSENGPALINFDISENQVNPVDFNRVINSNETRAKALKFTERNGVYVLSEQMDKIPSFEDVVSKLKDGEIFIYDSPERKKTMEYIRETVKFILLD